MEARNVILKGRVQGVGFRYFVWRRAREFNVAGWVRNLPGGDVEVQVEGESRELGEFLALIRRGPAMAFVVDSVEMKAPVQGFHGFTIKD